MMKRSFFALALVGAMSVSAMADSQLSYSADGATYDENTSGHSTDIVMTNLGGANTQLAGAGFGFSAPAGVTLVDFAWADVPFGDANNWFATGGLSPEAVRFFGGEAVPAEGLLLGTLTFDVGAAGDYTVNTGPTSFTDSNLAPITLGDGSDSFSISVVPEPATLALLAFGGFTAIRRRR